MPETAGARAVRFAERETLVSAAERDESGPECESLTAPDEIVADVRAIADAERFSRLTVAEKDAASSTEAPHDAGMEVFVMGRCGAGMFGIGMLGIDVLRCWQQACKFTVWQWTPQAAATVGAAIHTTIMARAAHGWRDMITNSRELRAARAPACAECSEENIHSV